MSKLEKLYKIQELMKEAEGLVEEVNVEGSSLNEYYGYSLEIIKQELHRFSDNAMGYTGRNTCIEEICDGEGTEWKDD